MVEEQILVIERGLLEEVGMFQGLTFDVGRYLSRIFSKGAARFMRRSRAEKEPAYKQIIPYVLLKYQDKYVSYVRGKRAGEKRLVGDRSIGIGGHINPVDDMPLLDSDFRKTYDAAVAREVAEEVCIEAGHTDRIVALLNDDSNEVGRVHLGIVHCWVLDSAQLSRREQMITQMSFMSPAELDAVRDTLETWSRVILSELPFSES